MKKIRTLFFLMIFVFILPVFCFSCGEVTLDSISYTLSEMLPSEVIDDIDSARTQTILNEIKMSLESTTSFKFTSSQTNVFSAEQIVNQTVSTVGKDREELIFSSKETNFRDKNLFSKTSKVYKKQTKNYNTKAYCYKLYESDFDAENDNKPSCVEYLREGIEYSTTTTLTNLYTNLIKKFDFKKFDNVYEKSFDGVKYYKLVADVEGLENIKDSFNLNPQIDKDPQLFTKQNNLDFVMDFYCEFGLKDSSGTKYITYFKMGYSVYNAKFEKYLEVTSKTTLKKYGEAVVVEPVEDEGIYTTCTFVDCMNEDQSYCKYYPYVDGNKSATAYTVVKIEKNEGETTYFDYSIKQEATSTNYYYIQGNISGEGDNKKVDYTTYKITDRENKYYVEEPNFVFDFGNFDFSLNTCEKKQDQGKQTYYYQFGNSTKNFIVRLKAEGQDLGEIDTIESSGTKLAIEAYGISDGSLGVISSLQGYTEETASNLDGD